MIRRWHHEHSLAPGALTDGALAGYRPRVAVADGVALGAIVTPATVTGTRALRHW